MASRLPLGSGVLVALLALNACSKDAIEPASVLEEQPNPPTPPPTVVHSGYYASTDGSGSADGSSSHPWTLAAALTGGNGRVRPGDTIWVRGGTYAGSFLSTVHGTSSEPVVIRAYPGERAILDGAGL